MRRPFYHSCVEWPGDVEQLHTLDDEGRQIKLDRFEQLVDPEQFKELQRALGYATERGDKGLRLSQDWHVNYYVHPLTRIPYMMHSAIHYVFATDEDLKVLDQIVDARLEAQTVIDDAPAEDRESDESFDFAL